MAAEVLTAILALLAAAPQTAVADPINTANTPEIIVVSGERMSRTVANTASSVAVLAEGELDRQPDVERFDQVLATTANVVLGSGGQAPTIRGQDTTGVLRDLPAFIGGTRPRTTMVVDGRAISYNELVFGTQPLWDVKQVEIFRSPQTTTQGQNSIAGAIFIETAPPEFEWGARVRALAASRNARQLSAAITGPLATDQLAIRLIADWRGGNTASEITSPVTGIDPNRDEFDLLRIKLLLTPSALPGLRVDAGFQSGSTQAPQIEGIERPFSERRHAHATYGIFRNRVDAFTVRSRWDLDDRTELSSTLTTGTARIMRFAPPGLGEATNRARDRSGELIMTRTAEPLRFLIGTSARLSKLTQTIDVSTIGFGSGFFRDRQESFGIFGEVDLDITDRLTLTAGGRYQSDIQKRSGTLGSGDAMMELDYRGRFRSFSPKLSLAYRAGPRTTVGAMVLRASNPGGATLSLVSGQLDAFRDEHLWDYEVFLRGSLAGGQFGYRVNFFRYAHVDAQSSVLQLIETPGGSYTQQEIGNLPRARSSGAEIEASWSPATRLQLGLSIGLLRTRVTEAPTDRDPLLGKQFQRSPHFTGSAQISWEIADNVLLNVEASHRSDYFSDDANSPSLRVSGAELMNVRMQWNSGKLQFFAFARNVFDSFYLTSLGEKGKLATAGEPRSIGVGSMLVF